MVNATKETGCGMWFFYGILCITGLFLFASPWMLSNCYTTDGRERSETVKQFMTYRYAMNQYHERYKRFPVHCTNITDLARVLDGENTNDDNSDEIRFFRYELPLKKRILDGFGYPFDLAVLPDGTNFILKSYGIKYKRPTAFRSYNVAVLYTQTLAETEAQLPAQIQTTTNGPPPTGRTNHDGSVSQ
jgi:hypothetical protein